MFFCPFLLYFWKQSLFAPGCPPRGFLVAGGAAVRCSLLSYGFGHAFGVRDLRYKVLGLHRPSGEPLVAIDSDFPRCLARVGLLAFAALVGVIDARSVPIDRVR